jgi:hypothetical protein
VSVSFDRGGWPSTDPEDIDFYAEGVAYSPQEADRAMRAAVKKKFPRSDIDFAVAQRGLISPDPAKGIISDVMLEVWDRKGVLSGAASVVEQVIPATGPTAEANPRRKKGAKRNAAPPNLVRLYNADGSPYTRHRVVMVGGTQEDPVLESRDEHVMFGTRAEVGSILYLAPGGDWPGYREAFFYVEAKGHDGRATMLPRHLQGKLREARYEYDRNRHSDWAKEEYEAAVEEALAEMEADANPRRRKKRARRNAFLYEPWDLIAKHKFKEHRGWYMSQLSENEKLYIALVTAPNGEHGVVFVRCVRLPNGEWNALEGIFFGQDGGGDDPTTLPQWADFLGWG